MQSSCVTTTPPYQINFHRINGDIYYARRLFFRVDARSILPLIKDVSTFKEVKPGDIVYNYYYAPTYVDKTRSVYRESPAGALTMRMRVGTVKVRKRYSWRNSYYYKYYRTMTTHYVPGLRPIMTQTRNISLNHTYDDYDGNRTAVLSVVSGVDDTMKHEANVTIEVQHRLRDLSVKCPRKGEWEMSNGLHCPQPEN